MVDYSIVILAGGKSSRMGEDKALSPFIGKITLIEYILQQLRGLSNQKLIISNNPDAYKRIGIPVFPDIIPDVGSLGGIYSGLFHASYENCLILACDMPFINRQLLEYMIKIASNFDAVIPRLKPNDFVEPLRAVYSKVCLPYILKTIDNGKRKVVSFFDDINIRFLEMEEISRFDPSGLTFFNVNTPEDLEEARRMVGRMKENF